MTDRDLIRDLAEALRCIAEHPVKYESIPGLERPTEFAVGSHYWHAIGDMRRAARIALTSARERLAREDQPAAVSAHVVATFEQSLEHAINCHSQENASNTPDFILAQFMAACLAAWNTATQQRETWYGRDARPATTETIAAQPAPEPAEPVAASWPNPCPVCHAAPPCQHSHPATLYAAPPSPAPVALLSEEEIGTLWDGHIVPFVDKSGINPIVFARAIEAAVRRRLAGE